jgi:IS6 family transposase
LTGEVRGSVSFLVSSPLGVRRVPLPGRGDRGGGPLVPRYGLSYRDVEELLAERGIEVDHVTVYRWVQRFTPLLADAARFTRHSPGDRWFVDETYVKVNGVWRYVYRAVDQHGQVIDVLLSSRRDAAAARRFFTRALRMLRVIPTEVVTDAAPVHPAVLEEVVPAAWHHVEQYANNRIAADHGQLKRRLRPMRGLKTDRTAQVVIAGHPSCRIFAAATTNSASTPTQRGGLPRRSPNSPRRSDTVRPSSACPLISQRNNAVADLPQPSLRFAASSSRPNPRSALGVSRFEGNKNDRSTSRGYSLG